MEKKLKEISYKIYYEDETEYFDSVLLPIEGSIADYKQQLIDRGAPNIRDIDIWEN